MLLDLEGAWHGRFGHPNYKIPTKTSNNNIAVRLDHFRQQKKITKRQKTTENDNPTEIGPPEWFSGNTIGPNIAVVEHKGLSDTAWSFLL